jgi:hypothetical protein
MWTPVAARRTAKHKARSRTNARTQTPELTRDGTNVPAVRVAPSSQRTNRLGILTFHEKPPGPRPSAIASQGAEAGDPEQSTRQRTVTTPRSNLPTNLPTAPRGEGMKHTGGAGHKPGMQRKYLCRCLKTIRINIDLSSRQVSRPGRRL